MAVVRLKSGQVIDTQGLSNEEVQQYVVPNLAEDEPNEPYNVNVLGTRDRSPSGKMKLKGSTGDPTVGNQALSTMLGTATGGLMGGVLANRFPATSPGGYAAMLGGPLVGKTAGILDKVNNPTLRALLSSVLGIGGTEGLTALSEGTNRLAQPDRPHENMTTSNPLDLFLGAVPGMADYFTHGTVKNAPSSKSAGLMSLLTHDVDPSAVRGAQTLDPRATLAPSEAALDAGNPASRIAGLTSNINASKDLITLKQARTAEAIMKETKDLADARQASEARLRGLQQQQAANQMGQSQVQTGLAGNATDQAQIKFDQARAEMKGAAYPSPPDYYKKQAKAGTNLQLAKKQLEGQREQERLAYIQAEADRLSQEQQLERANQPISQIPEIRAKGATDIRRERSYQAGLRGDIENLQTQADTYEAMNPGVRRLAWTPTPGSGRLRPTVDEVIKRVADPATTADEITGLRTHLSNQGATHVDDFQKAMTEEFMKQAYDINTKNLTNAPALMKAGGPFSPDKLAAIYGVGPRDPKIAEFTRAVDDISALGTSRGLIGNFAKQAASHAAWVTGSFLMFPGSALSAKAATAATAAAVSITWPKLIDMVLSNPKIGKDFHQWATSTDRSMRSLTNWPSLAARMKDISEPVDWNSTSGAQIDAEVKELMKRQGTVTPTQIAVP